MVPNIDYGYNFLMSMCLNFASYNRIATGFVKFDTTHPDRGFSAGADPKLGHSSRRVGV